MRTFKLNYKLVKIYKINKLTICILRIFITWQSKSITITTAEPESETQTKRETHDII